MFQPQLELLGITPEQNNGTTGLLNGMLRSPGTFPMTSKQFAGQTSCPYDSNKLMGDFKTGCECGDSELEGPAQSRGNDVFGITSSSGEKHRTFIFL